MNGDYDGIISLDRKKITYKFEGNIEERKTEREIKSWNKKTGRMSRSAGLSKEILQTLFDGADSGTLSFKHLVEDVPFTCSISTNIRGGMLLTGESSGLHIGENWLLVYLASNLTNFIPFRNTRLTINPSQENSAFAAIGVNSRNAPALIKNHGTITVNTYSALFANNRIYTTYRDNGAVLIENDVIANEINLNVRSVVIVNSIINSLNSYAQLISTCETTTFGADDAEMVDVSDNTVRGKINVCLISNGNSNSSNLKVNGRRVHISNNNIISPEGVDVQLIRDLKGIITIGTPDTEMLDINNNNVVGEAVTSLIQVGRIFTINSKLASIKDNIASSIIENRGIININLYGIDPRFELSNKNRTPEGREDKGTVTMYYDSKLNFTNNSDTEATIVIGDNILGYGSKKELESTITFRGIRVNSRNTNKIKENSRPSGKGINVVDEENIFLSSGIAVGDSDTDIGIMIPNPKGGDNNYNSTFFNTNNNNEDEDDELNNGSSFKVLLKSNLINVNRINVETNVIIHLNGGKLSGVGCDPLINIDKDATLIFIGKKENVENYRFIGKVKFVTDVDNDNYDSDNDN